MIGQKSKWVEVYHEYTRGLTTVALHGYTDQLSLVVSTVFEPHSDRQKALALQPFFQASPEAVVKAAIGQHEALVLERDQAAAAEEDAAEMRRLANNAAALAHNQAIEDAIERSLEGADANG